MQKAADRCSWGRALPVCCLLTSKQASRGLRFQRTEQETNLQVRVKVEGQRQQCLWERTNWKHSRNGLQPWQHTVEGLTRDSWQEKSLIIKVAVLVLPSSHSNSIRDFKMGTRPHINDTSQPFQNVARQLRSGMWWLSATRPKRHQLRPFGSWSSSLPTLCCLGY